MLYRFKSAMICESKSTAVQWSEYTLERTKVNISVVVRFDKHVQYVFFILGYPGVIPLATSNPETIS